MMEEYMLELVNFHGKEHQEIETAKNTEIGECLYLKETILHVKFADRLEVH